MNVGFQAVAVGVFGWSGRMGALTIGLCSGNRNLAVVIAVLPAGIHPDILLYFAMMQLPIYMLPALQLPLYRRLLQGSPDKPAEGDG
jgi:BASS family bile acid:Na+ symporter